MGYLGRASVAYTVAVGPKARPKAVALHHYIPDRTDDRSDEIKPTAFDRAPDGLTVPVA